MKLVHHDKIVVFRKALRAFLILCPMLGISYVLVVVSHLIHQSVDNWSSLIFAYYTTAVSATQVIN